MINYESEKSDKKERPNLNERGDRILDSNKGQ